MKLIEFKNRLEEIFEYINDKHPGFYFFHNKDELNIELAKYLNKDNYDRYDLYYAVMALIKFMVGKYDSHTKVFFDNEQYLPFVFKVINNEVYIIYASKNNANFVGKKLISINGINTQELIKEIGNITCYSTKESLYVNIATLLGSYDVLRSLPSIENNCDEFVIETDGGKIILYYGSFEDVICPPFKENLSFEIKDNVVVIYYNMCCGKEKIECLINNISKISEEQNINKYIVDIRDNGGGDSSVIKPLVNYLKGKKVVCLVNEKVFSSGRMALVDLKNIGAYIIGTDIRTSLNCFGNNNDEYNLKDLELYVHRSTSYWLYDEEYNCRGFEKNNFASYFNNKRELLEPVEIHPDKYIKLSLENILNNNDVQMKEGLKYLIKKI